MLGYMFDELGFVIICWVFEDYREFVFYGGVEKSDFVIVVVVVWFVFDD